MQAIRALIDEVVLTPEDGALRIDLNGELAAILRLCRDGQEKQKPAAFGDGLEEQMDLVAGAGFVLCDLFSASGLTKPTACIQS